LACEILHYNNQHANRTAPEGTAVIARPRRHSHSRRDFFSRTLGRALAFVPALDLAFYRASWTRALAQTTATQKLFHIQKAAEGVYFAETRPLAMIISSAVIFVNARDVLVVDSQTTPSASAALINQIKKEVTEKPVRYVVNTHFHDDHSQGNAAFKRSYPKVDFLATKVTAELIAKEVPVRLKETIEKVIPESMEKVRGFEAKAKSAAEKEFWADQFRQYKAFAAEMKNFQPELPTITFDNMHVIRDREHELQIGFHGRAHTAGDVCVYCPQKRVLATGDMINGSLPYMPDGFPKAWVKTIDAVNQLDWNQVLSAHGPIMPRDRVVNYRNFIEEMNGRVEIGKRAGKTLEELKKSITIDSLRSLHDHDYARYVADIRDSLFPHWGRTFVNIKENFQDAVNGVTSNCYRRIDFG
jgi:glyoxylase-like metal-dependent hydrolase (beta-lactamase superfamily II)